MSDAARDFEVAFAQFMAAAQAAVDADHDACNARLDERYPGRVVVHDRLVLSFMRGPRYIRIVIEGRNGSGNRAAFAFVDPTNGDVFKTAGWKGPAKNFARGNIYDAQHGCGGVKWTGALMSTDNTMIKLEAEILYGDQAKADAGSRALTAAGFIVVTRDDWNDDPDDADDWTACVWGVVRTIAADEDAFADHLKTIIEPHGGLLWAWGEGWTRNKYASGCVDADEQVEQDELLQ